MSEVTLERAPLADESLLANLLELYIHDMSEFFPLKVDREGRFRYDRLPLYSSQPDSHRAYFIRCNDELAGFALIARGSVASTDPAVLDLNEFFILRSYRRQNIGRRAASLLWDMQPAQWIVRVAQNNQRALQFWDATVRQYADREVSTSELAGKTNRYLVYGFASRACSSNGRL
jgi:predicted acetyltransferase